MPVYRLVSSMLAWALCKEDTVRLIDSSPISSHQLAVFVLPRLCLILSPMFGTVRHVLGIHPRCLQVEAA